MARPGGIFIGGTGTAVGKTVFTVLLMTYLKSLGLRVAPLKPAETGCLPDASDAAALLAASGEDYALPLICPYRFKLPAAPEAAAEKEGRSVRFTKIRDAFDRLRASADLVIVEVAGAMETPYAEGLTGTDIAAKLETPVILVTSEILGTVGQTLSAVKALKYSNVPCLGVVLSVTSPGPYGPHHETNEKLIRAHLARTPFLGTLPCLDIPGGSFERMTAPKLRAWAEGQLSLFRERIGGALDKILPLP
jgi:dethiobiotin synthetase